MFFRRRRAPADAPPPAWAEVAVAMEFERLDDEAEEALRADLAVDTGRVQSLHALRRDRQPELLAFEHVRPNPSGRGDEERRFRLLLRSGEGVAIAPASWRAFPSGHPLLTSLQESRTGGATVHTGDDEFDARVAVVAREPAPVAGTLTAPVRAALVSLLAGDLPAATVTCGPRHLAWRLHRETDPPFREVDRVASRLLHGYAALRTVAPDR